MNDDCDFGDDCRGELKGAHKALADIARAVEEGGGNCDGDEGIPDVVRGVSSYIDNAKEELAQRDEKVRAEANGLEDLLTWFRDKMEGIYLRDSNNDDTRICFKDALEQLVERYAALRKSEPVTDKAKVCRCQRHEENGHYEKDCPFYKACLCHKIGNCADCFLGCEDCDALAPTIPEAKKDGRGI